MTSEGNALRLAFQSHSPPARGRRGLGEEVDQSHHQRDLTDWLTRPEVGKAARPTKESTLGDSGVSSLQTRILQGVVSGFPPSVHLFPSSWNSWTRFFQVGNSMRSPKLNDSFVPIESQSLPVCFFGEKATR